MAFLRFTRDKRGYEHFYLVQPSRRRGMSAARVLYWFRTPPNVKVGREPFDEHIRRELETQNPDVTFDWRKILETPIPSADAEKWRDRRRAERAARAARRGGVQDGEPVDSPGTDRDAASDEAIEADRESATEANVLADAPVNVIDAAAEAPDSPSDPSRASGSSRTESSDDELGASEQKQSTPLESGEAPEPPPSAGGEPFDSPLTLSVSKGEPLAQDRLVEPRPVGSGERSRRKRRRRRHGRGGGGSGPAGPAGKPPSGPGGDV